MHVSRLQRRGSLDAGHRTLEERFWPKVDRNPDGCWLWTAGVDGHGYGQIHFKGRHRRAHRIAYELAVGPIPEGLVINHLCCTPRCVRPDHLETVSVAENNHYADHVLFIRSAVTHCKNGHEFTPENTYIFPGRGSRDCRTCRRARMDAFRARRRGAA